MPQATPPKEGEEVELVTSADGTEIAFERTGSGPPLLLVHGMVGDRDNWEALELRSPLAEHFTVCTMDRRGHGDSGGEGPYEIERVFEDIITVVEEIEEPVALFGLSTGGVYALGAASRTDNVRALLLYEPSLQFGQGAEAAESYTEMMSLLDTGKAEEALLVALEDFGHLSSEEINLIQSSPLWQEQMELVHTVPWEIEAITGYEFDPDQFRNMSTPTLLITGSESARPYKDGIKRTEEALPDVHVATIEGHGHAGLATASERFLEEVLTFAGE
ncbi:alpha/beta hydrolase fold protein [Natronococcus amylolyticus DSM 10524]|uniref:Alpha/beta hydrolase fold protein n=1 Tax=Natronococcus amylolyticus DSM 10524 TaxID=1227497 RepID=L9X800_9EURY|nr:alpha/beta hydrolase [Natronococcus amylolyticus]ELY56763.1 alpha/beta hydrolase fold protein [Natronococcus amylolyticus DSM 10524]